MCVCMLIHINIVAFVVCLHVFNTFFLVRARALLVLPNPVLFCDKV